MGDNHTDYVHESYEDDSSHDSIDELFSPAASSVQSASDSSGRLNKKEIRCDSKLSTQVVEPGPVRGKSTLSDDDLEDAVFSRYLSQLQSSPHDLTGAHHPQPTPYRSNSSPPGPAAVTNSNLQRISSASVSHQSSGSHLEADRENAHISRSQRAACTADVTGRPQNQDANSQSAQGNAQGQRQISPRTPVVHTTTTSSTHRLQRDMRPTDKRRKLDNIAKRPGNSLPLGSTRTPSALDTVRNTNGVERHDLFSRPLQSKRPLTPNAPERLTAPKKAKRLPFDDGSSGDEDSKEQAGAAPQTSDFEKTTARPGQSIAQKLNLGRLSQMLNVKSKSPQEFSGTRTFFAKVDTPEPHSSIDNPFRKPASSTKNPSPSLAKKESVPMPTSMPEKGKAKESGLVTEASTRMSKRSTSDVEATKSSTPRSATALSKGFSIRGRGGDSTGGTDVAATTSKFKPAETAPRTPRPPPFNPFAAAKLNNSRQVSDSRSPGPNVGERNLSINLPWSSSPAPARPKNDSTTTGLLLSTGEGNYERSNARHEATKTRAATDGVSRQSASISLHSSLGIAASLALPSKPSVNETDSKCSSARQSMQARQYRTAARTEQTCSQVPDSTLDGQPSSVEASKTRKGRSILESTPSTAPVLSSTRKLPGRGLQKTSSVGQVNASNRSLDISAKDEMSKKEKGTSGAKVSTVRIGDETARTNGVPKSASITNLATHFAESREAVPPPRSLTTQDALSLSSNEKTHTGTDITTSSKTKSVQLSPKASRTSPFKSSKQTPSTNGDDARPQDQDSTAKGTKTHGKVPEPDTGTNIGPANVAGKPKTNTFKPPPPLSADDRRHYKLTAFEAAQEKARRILNKTLGVSDKTDLVDKVSKSLDPQTIINVHSIGGKAGRVASDAYSRPKSATTPQIAGGKALGAGILTTTEKESNAKASSHGKMLGKGASNETQNGREVGKSKLDKPCSVKPVRPAKPAMSKKSSAGLSALLDEISDVSTALSNEGRNDSGAASKNKLNTASKDTPVKSIFSATPPYTPVTNGTAVGKPKPILPSQAPKVTSAPAQSKKSRTDSKANEDALDTESVTIGTSAKHGLLPESSVTVSTPSDERKIPSIRTICVQENTNAPLLKRHSKDVPSAGATESDQNGAVDRPATSRGARLNVDTFPPTPTGAESKLSSPKAVSATCRSEEPIESRPRSSGLELEEAGRANQSGNVSQSIPLSPQCKTKEVKKSTPPRSLVRKPQKVHPEKQDGIEPTVVSPSATSTPATIRLVHTPPSRETEPYFEFTVYEKLYTGPDCASSTASSNISGQLTSLDEANRLADQRFNYINTEDARHKQIQFSSWTNKRDQYDCVSYTGIFAPLDFPAQKSYYKVWVERQVVCGLAAAVQPPQRDTSFVGKNVYILRLFKLVDNPSVLDISADDSNEDEAKADTTSDASTTDSEVERHDPDFGKHAKKARSKQRNRSGSSSSSDSDVIHVSKSRSKTKSQSASQRPAHNTLRIHHPISDTSEIYTTLAHANRAARRLQIELSHEKEPSSPLTAKWQEQNRRELEAKIKALEEKSAGGDGEQKGESGFWNSVFNGVGRGGDRFELVVEETRLGGPRNV